MGVKEETSDESRPVCVIEKIPVKGDHEVTAAVIESEGIPTPENLQLYPELGRGGMGRIHPCTDLNLLRHVALKRLDKESSKVPMYLEGFIAEAQMTGQLEHPNIVPVHELGVGENGVPYFTMKLVQGASFDEWLREPWRAPGSRERLQEGLEIFVKVCDAMAYAHHRGVIHRDLKPENIMVGEFGQVYLMDWGLARLSKTRAASGANSQMEAHGATGTPDYMAPEQARGVPEEMDELTDIFGLGAVLYEVITGQRPYGRLRDSEQILTKAIAGQVVPIAQALGDVGVSRRICAVAEKALSKSKADRYQTVLDMQEAVRAFLRGGLHLPRKAFSAGATIVSEGAVGHSAYMIVAGKCRVYRTVNGEQEILTTMGPGDVFGEMALLLDEPRAASVEAIDKVTVLDLDKTTIMEGLGADGWTGALVKALATRFMDLELQVRQSGIKRSNPAPSR